MKKLKMSVEGGWDLVFEPHYFCGRARDSLNVKCYTYISKEEKIGNMAWMDIGVITRKDLKRLRSKIDEVLSKRAERLKLVLPKHPSKHANDKREASKDEERR